MLLRLIVAAVLLCTLSAKAAPPNSTSLRKINEQKPLDHACRLMQVDSESEDEAFPDWFCELDARDADGVQGKILPIEGLELPEEKMAQAFDQETLINPEGYFVEDDFIVIPEGMEVELLDSEGNFPNRASPVGEQSVLMIHVTAGNQMPSTSPDDLSDDLYGTFGDPFNMLTQFDDCSYGKFTISPFNGDINGVAVENGVYETTIVDPMVSSPGIYERLVVDQLAKEFGPTWRTDAGIDLVMICLPIRGFTAYAYIRGYLSVYSDFWCTGPSGHMHEIGHNLGLFHSNEGGQTYADQSCLMGFSYPSEDDTPAMCFNGPKSWQLNWYEDRHISIDGTSDWEGDLVGISSYESASEESIILRIEGSGFGPDKYVMFNHADGINAGVKEGANQVLVTEQFGGFESSLLAKLNQNGEYEFDGPGGSFVIKAKNIDLVAKPARATVAVMRPRETCLGFNLWDADSKQLVSSISTQEPDVFCKQDWGFSVEVLTKKCDAVDVHSMEFEVTGPDQFSSTRTENREPWFAFGNRRDKSIRGVSMRVGTYNFKVTVYTESGVVFTESVSFGVEKCRCEVPLRPE